MALPPETSVSLGGGRLLRARSPAAGAEAPCCGRRGSLLQAQRILAAGAEAPCCGPVAAASAKSSSSGTALAALHECRILRAEKEKGGCPKLAEDLSRMATHDLWPRSLQVSPRPPVPIQPDLTSWFVGGTGGRASSFVTKAAGRCWPARPDTRPNQRFPSTPYSGTETTPSNSG